MVKIALQDIPDLINEYTAPDNKVPEDPEFDKITNILDARDALRSLDYQNRLKSAQLELLASEVMSQAFKTMYYERYLKRENLTKVIEDCKDKLLEHLPVTH